MLDPSSFRSCAAPQAPAPSLQGRYRRRQARRYGARCWLTWSFLGVMRKIVMPGLVPGIHVLLLEMERKTWLAETSPAMTKSDNRLTASAPRARPIFPSADRPALHWLWPAASALPEWERSSWSGPDRAVPASPGDCRHSCPGW